MKTRLDKNRCGPRSMATKSVWLLLAHVAVATCLARPIDAIERLDTQAVSVLEHYAGARDLRATQRGGVSLQEAVRIATSRYQGRVVRAVTTERGGRRIHEIRILLSEGGRVVTVRVDAETGAVR